MFEVWAMWLGKRRGYLQDWITQLWVKATGRRVHEKDVQWLATPIGNTDLISDTYIDSVCRSGNLVMRKDEARFGLLNSLDDFGQTSADLERLNPIIKHFYLNTHDYHLEVWSKWIGIWKFFGWVLRITFTRRLQQLNLPIDPMDSAKGLESHVIKLFSESDDVIPAWTIWHRILKSKNDVIYSGIYATTIPPESERRHLKVSFPLPNGAAVVIMRMVVTEAGDFKLISDGRKRGQSGFYFLLTNHKGKFWIRYVKTMHETIHLYADGPDAIRADHDFWIWGMKYMKLHYRITPKQDSPWQAKSSELMAIDSQH